MKIEMGHEILVSASASVTQKSEESQDNQFGEILKEAMGTSSDAAALVPGLTMVYSDSEAAVPGLTMAYSDYQVVVPGISMQYSDSEAAVPGLTMVYSDLEAEAEGLATLNSTESIGFEASPTSTETPAVELTERLLDTLDAYCQKLGDRDVALSDMDPLIHEIKRQSEALTSKVDALPDADPLREILNQALIVSSLEVLKFNRGDYSAT